MYVFKKEVPFDFEPHLRRGESSRKARRGWPRDRVGGVVLAFPSQARLRGDALRRLAMHRRGSPLAILRPQALIVGRLPPDCMKRGAAKK